MKYYIKIFTKPLALIVSVMCLMVTSLPVTAQVNVEDVNAVVNEYMSSLMSGNIKSLRNNMEKSHLNKKNKRLKSKGYNAYLKKMYKKARYKILHTEVTGVDSAIVDLRVIYKKNDYSEFRLWLQDSGAYTGIKVVRESEIF